MTDKSWYTISNKAPRVAQVDILDEIGSWYGVTAKDFAAQLDALDVDEIHLRINSPGGDVFDGVAIMNTLRQHKANVTANVIGIAASAASFIAVGGADEVVMADNSMLMIHDASGVVLGNAEDMHEMAGLLDQISDNIASVYATKAGGSTREWRDVMRSERWYSAAAAVDAGLADRADTTDVGDRQPTDELRACVYASAIRQPGHGIEDVRTAAAALGALTTDPPADPGQESTTQPKEDPVSEILMAGLRDRLGIAADAEVTEEGVLNALDKVLTAPPAASETPKADLPEGTVLIDSAVLDSLKHEVEIGRKALDEQRAAGHAAIVDKAISDGKIPPARRDHWLAQMNADEEGAVQVLDQLAAGTIPLEPIGYTGGVDESEGSDDALYNKLFRTNAKEA